MSRNDFFNQIIGEWYVKMGMGKYDLLSNIGI